MIYLRLFWSFFQIGLLSFGGGYAAMPLIQQQAVVENSWLTMQEFADIITIAEMTPGPIAVNSATFVGLKVAGLLGAVVATLGCVFPSCIIVLTLAYFYYKYRSLSLVQGVLSCLRPAVVALIASAGLSILLLCIFREGQLPSGVGDVSFTGILLFAGALFVLRKWKPNPIFVMLSAGIIGMFVYRFLPNA